MARSVAACSIVAPFHRAVAQLATGPRTSSASPARRSPRRGRHGRRRLQQPSRARVSTTRIAAPAAANASERAKGSV